MKRHNKRRPKGSGTVSKRGKYYIARLIIGYEESGKPILRTATRRTRDEALRKLEEWVSQRPSSVQAERTTFEQYAVQWLRFPKNFNENTREVRLHALNHAIPYVGHLPLAKITPEHIHQVFLNMNEAGVGSTMQQTTFFTLRTMFNDLYEDDVISSVPVRRRHRPVKIASVPDEPLTEGQISSILDAAKSIEGFHSLYLLAARLGLREGELLALQCEDVKLQSERPYLFVRRHLRKENNRYVLGAFTKTGFARQILLPRFMLPALAETLLLRGSQGLMFPSPEGHIYDPKNFRNRNWKHVLMLARLQPVRFHLLRHTATTHALERGEPALAICQRLGWKSTRMLFARYGHLTDRMQLGAVEALERAYGQTDEPISVDALQLR